MTELQISLARYVFRAWHAIIGRMHTRQSSREKVSTALRSGTAGFFKMKLSCHGSGRPAQDHNPLRRTLKWPKGMEVWESNENMCFALWQLLSRS